MEVNEILRILEEMNVAVIATADGAGGGTVR